MKKSTKSILVVIFCMLGIILICLGMIKYWVELQAYEDSALIGVIILAILASYFFIIYLKKVRQGK